jgi:hypothetical protein
MERIRLGTQFAEVRTFLTEAELHRILDLDRYDPDVYARTRGLLLEAELLTPHRYENRRGYLMPEGWEPIHAHHLARRGAALRREARTRRSA